MSPSISRHARLTSLVGTLLTVAVAACLVAFSLVAQHAAQQSPEAPEVRPITPQSGRGAPLELGRSVVAEEDEQRTSEEPIEELIARANGPVPPRQHQVRPDDEPTHPRRGGAQRPAPEPRPGGRCSVDCPPSQPRPAADPSPPAESDEQHCGKGHFKGRGKGHEKGQGQGHCEHDDDDVAQNEEGGDDDGKEPGRGPGKGKDKSKDDGEKDEKDNSGDDDGDVPADPPGQSHKDDADKDEGKGKGKGKDDDD